MCKPNKTCTRDTNKHMYLREIQQKKQLDQNYANKRRNHTWTGRRKAFEKHSHFWFTFALYLQLQTEKGVFDMNIRK